MPVTTTRLRGRLGAMRQYSAALLLIRLYDGLVALAVWLLLAPREWLAGASLRERLGRPPLLRERGERLILLHGVSVGEQRAVAALARRWARRHPRDRLVLTAGNRDGLAAAESLAASLPSVAAVTPLPWDRRRAIDRWLRALAPDLVVVVETEIWPRLFLACRALGIPLALASARVYPRDVPRYRWLPTFFRAVLAAPAWIGARSADDARRLVAIGACAGRVEVAGDLKYDARPVLVPVIRALDALAAPIVVGASTHRGEESRLIEAARNLRSLGRPVRLVLAPRHPHRAKAVVRQARRAGMTAVSLAELERGDGPPEVVVVDRLGVLSDFLSRADLVVLGGTLVPIGGHNPLEAAAAGRAVIAGPHVDHFAETIADLGRRGALRSLAAGAELLPTLVALLDRDEERRRMGERAAAAVAAGSCVDRYCERLEELLGGASAAVGGGAAHAASKRRA
jgi:3-deoxy-D-manno-octulosonic-acid transferase